MNREQKRASKRMPYIKRFTPMGFEGTIEYYPAPAFDNHTKKGKRRNPTSEDQKNRNDRYAARKLHGLILANFAPGIDLFTTLTYPDKTNKKEVQRREKNLLDFCRSWCKRNNRTFQYILITEKQGKWHHHLIMTYIPEDVIREYWKPRGGRATISTLDQERQYFDLVNYLLEDEKPSRDPNAPPDQQVNAKRKRKKNEKRWSCSHGLLEPEDSVRILDELPKKKPRAPRGYKVVEDTIEAVTDRWGTRMTCKCIWVGEGIPTVYEKTRQKAIKQRLAAHKAMTAQAAKDSRKRTKKKE